MTTPNQPPDGEGQPARSDPSRGPAELAPANEDADGLGPGAQASYRDDAPPRHGPAQDAGKRVPGTPGAADSRLPPASRIRVAGTGSAPMSTTEYQQAVEAVAVLIARHDARHAEAA